MADNDLTVSKTFTLVVGGAPKPLSAEYNIRTREVCMRRGDAVLFLPVAYARELHAWLEDIFSGIAK